MSFAYGLALFQQINFSKYNKLYHIYLYKRCLKWSLCYIRPLHIEIIYLLHLLTNLILKVLIFRFFLKSIIFDIHLLLDHVILMPDPSAALTYITWTLILPYISGCLIDSHHTLYACSVSHCK